MFSLFSRPTVPTVLITASEGEIIPGLSKTGAFMVLVEDVNDSGASATFCMSNSSNMVSGSVTRMTSSNGVYGEHLSISWGKDDYPRLKIMTSGKFIFPKKYKVKIV
jgi:hypothetical protein